MVWWLIIGFFFVRINELGFGYHPDDVIVWGNVDIYNDLNVFFVKIIFVEF